MSFLYTTNRFAILLLLQVLTATSPLMADSLTLNTPVNAQSPYYPPYPPTHESPQFSADLIQRGEYLTKMGDCISCHTDYQHQGASFSGGLPLKTPFGTFYSPNITPDKKTGIGNWSEADFIRALKEGRNPQGQYYFPVFPYVYFANITEDDARAMYAYLMSIPAVEKPNKPLPFPFSLPGARLSLLGWNLLFYYPNQPYAPDVTQTEAWNRGQYLVDSLGHCSMCHTPLNALGAPKKRHYLAGGFIDGYWAPNITGAGLKTATHQEVVNVFKHHELINQAGPVAGPMAEVNHNSLMYLTDDDLLAIATYLKTVKSVDPLSLPPSDAPPSLERGKQVYLQACAVCHQDGAMSAPIIGSSASWFTRIKDNPLAVLYQHVINGYNSMPVKGGCVTCSDNDLISAVDYVLNHSLTRSQWLDLNTERTAIHTNTSRDKHVE